MAHTPSLELRFELGDDELHDGWTLAAPLRPVKRRTLQVSYGKIFLDFEAPIRAQVQGQVVHDLGAGDTTLALQLVGLGAKQVLLLDKEHIFTPPSLQSLKAIRTYYSDWTGWEDVRVAFLSWPPSHTPGLVKGLEKVPTVIYMGANHGGTSAGSVALFQHFLQRPLLTYIPNPKNSLLIYGSWNREADPRSPVGEEQAGLSFLQSLWFWELHPEIPLNPA